MAKKKKKQKKAKANKPGKEDVQDEAKQVKVQTKTIALHEEKTEQKKQKKKKKQEQEQKQKQNKQQQSLLVKETTRTTTSSSSSNRATKNVHDSDNDDLSNENVHVPLSVPVPAPVPLTESNSDGDMENTEHILNPVIDTNNTSSSPRIASASLLPPPLPPPPKPIPVPMPTTPSTNTISSNFKSNFSSWEQAFQAAASITPHHLGDDYVDPSIEINDNDSGNGVSGNIKGVSEIALSCIQGDNYSTSTSTSTSTRNNTHFNSNTSSNEKKRTFDEVNNLNDDSPVDTHDNDDETKKVVVESASVLESTVTPSPKKKKKKNKKEKKKSAKKQKGDDKHNDNYSHNHNHLNTNNSDKDDDENETHPPLEGRLTSHNNESIMVLVDKTKKIVYSATRRTNDDVDDYDHNGNGHSHLVPIGHIDDADNVRITAEINSDGEADDGDDVKTNEDFPFAVDPNDHCESPLNAYEDIRPILDILVQLLGRKTNDQLSIYDPYYCNGLTLKHLKDLGYSNVYNKKEDCYATWSASTHEQPKKSKRRRRDQEEQQAYYPKYDVFVTNPPYSSDHIEKMIQHLTTDERTRGKPWCLLMPTYVHKKDYYKERVISKKNPQKGDQGKVQPFYLVPKRRYVYLPPPNFRQKKVSDVHRKSSPFVSMWFVWGGTKERTELLIKGYKEWEKKRSNKCTCDLARTKSALRDLRRKQK